MPEHFLALIKQRANLASNSEAERTATAFVSSLAATLDESIFCRINYYLPDYLQMPPKRQFFLHRKKEDKQFNQQIFLDRIVHTLKLTDRVEAENRVSGVLYALTIIQPMLKEQLSPSIPTNLNEYW